MDTYNNQTATTNVIGIGGDNGDDGVSFSEDVLVKEATEK